ncbi:outer membrane protein with beta-barrel domain [Pontibacter mucosus]|uniref:Outer membrane protein with beta-barrel domain n=1 Tax=Pontibacter mucosus TaxID=1649266 RepID=A0A2T5YLR0_9BACT|nr:outer membrane beta-barrel protein [Pontibacter mucosus]PTX20227.1 outer membrane protein with beta-barrel domain [Pontibacter mucosus]
MKRILLLVMAICMAAATGVSAKGGTTLKDRLNSAEQDTIVVKMANGATMILHLENIQQLQAFQNYSLDSLMRELTKYVERVEQMENSNQESREMTVTFNKSEQQGGQGEQVTITVQEQDPKTGKTHKETHEVVVNKHFKIKVDVEENDGNTRVNVDVPSRHERDSLRKEHKMETYKATRTGFDVDLGFNTFTEQGSDVADLRPWGSRYVSLNFRLKSQIGGQKSPFHLVSGLEFAFNNYMFEDDIVLQEIDRTTFFALDPERSYEKSKLTHSSVNLPLMATLEFKRNNGKEGLKIGAGPFVGYRLGAHTKLKYKEDGKTEKDKTRDSFNLSDFQYGVEGVLGYGGVDLFAKYNMNDLFKDNRGPQTNVISFGIRLFY